LIEIDLTSGFDVENIVGACYERLLV